MANQKAEFRNESGGFLGVIVIEPGGKERGISVRPGDSIWLSEEDQIATANAPRSDDNNPFINGQLKLVTAATAIANRRPIGDTTQPQPNEEAQRSKAVQAQEKKKAAAASKQQAEAERTAEGRKQAEQGHRPAPKRQAADQTGAAPQPQGTAAQGSRAEDEEVGTPEAAAAAS